VADYSKLERARAQLGSYFDRKFGTGSAVITIPRYQAEAARDRNTRLVTLILFLALAALVIAAANVTNILFSRAIRKRRSVGILKALGATRRGVFQLFFLEALLIGFGGAVVGAGLSVLMSKLMQDTMGYGAIYVSLLAAGIIGPRPGDGAGRLPRHAGGAGECRGSHQVRVGDRHEDHTIGPEQPGSLAAEGDADAPDCGAGVGVLIFALSISSAFSQLFKRQLEQEGSW